MKERAYRKTGLGGSDYQLRTSALPPPGTLLYRVIVFSRGGFLGIEQTSQGMYGRVSQP